MRIKLVDRTERNTPETPQPLAGAVIDLRGAVSRLERACQSGKLSDVLICRAHLGQAFHRYHNAEVNPAIGEERLEAWKNLGEMIARRAELQMEVAASLLAGSLKLMESAETPENEESVAVP